MSQISLQIVQWYRQNKRDLPWRNTSDPYKIWLSEIILQQTRVAQGLPYYEKFVEKFPSVFQFAQSEEIEILNTWQGLGYYSRARNMHATAKFIVNELKGEFPTNYDQLIQLKGIGPYTAAAIASFAYNEKKAVVDGNVSRVIARIFGIEEPINETKGSKLIQTFADELIESQTPSEFNQAIMEFGALQCSPKNPNCEICPLIALCEAFAKQKVDFLPVKTKKVKVKIRHFHYLVYLNQNKIILEHRIHKDIWQNLYTFPIIETSTEAQAIEDQYDYRLKIETNPHILTHQKIHQRFYIMNGTPVIMRPNWIEITLEQLEDYPHPRAIELFLERYLAEIS